jgi:hypothetical protein
MLILDDPHSWPKHITQQLKKRSVTKLLRQNRSIRDIRDEWDIRCMFADVQEYAQSHGMAAYHCTKQVPERPFSQTGLKVLHLEEHHRDLLETMRRHRLDLGEDYWERVRDILVKWRVGEEAREGRLDFCARQCLVVDDGTDKFFKYYGGEAGYMPFIYGLHPDVEEILERIGEPVVVEVRLRPSDLLAWQDSPGPALVGHYAHLINPDFLDEDYVTQIQSNVEPRDIIRVYPHAEFVDMVMTRRKTKQKRKPKE